MAEGEEIGARSPGRSGEAGAARRPSLTRREERAVEEAVAFINSQAVRSGLEVARDVGQYVLYRFFDGSYESFADQGRSKPASFRALVRREDLLLAPRTLYGFVHVAHQLEELPAATAERLGVSHHKALLPLSDLEEKSRLAEQAVAERWTKRELEAAVRRLQPAPQRDPRRPRSWLRTAGRLHRLSEAMLVEEVTAEELGALEPEAVDRLLAQIDEVATRLRWLHASIEQARGLRRQQR